MLRSLQRILGKNEPSFPKTGFSSSDYKDLSVDTSAEYGWLNHIKMIVEDNDPEKDQDMQVSWAAFHSSQIQETTQLPPDISCLMPLFQEEAKSVTMILHAMNVINCTVQFLNPGQIPVIEADQPLFAITKKIQ